ncbi:uncharacterized protein BT62DRAFT_1074567 [Guyanagaster necrorhizus]|uniref:Uncharacterized protein n=1 Tax=Guyanagaster necrorhizus TaxID=856835 RepID=A0A9P7VX39_9AGAR|nr:uncharacterized protein BT62DRAFT_1074567 [Guyanagaster necrorhizus MCA 3950]KAG7448050.1 hypothetical protein BT62DRAFT_1074567 [Guyanagaster necrorhizus MCA 3950]
MALRRIRVIARTSTALNLAILSSSLTKDMSTMAIFPPACAAFAILEQILQIVKDVQSNKEACHRLVHKCARILFNINEQMEGRWESASPLLLKNISRFQETLTMIHAFMVKETQAKWSSRLLRKNSIEGALNDYSELLDEASQAFQIAALINIQHTVEVSAAQKQNSKLAIEAQGSRALETVLHMPQPRSSTPPPYHNTNRAVTEESVQDDFQYAFDDIDNHGFQRYHKSEVRLKGSLGASTSNGWWSDVNDALVYGEPSLVRRYDQGTKTGAVKAWIHDVRILQNLYHPNLPQMIGVSSNEAGTPFIVLSHVQWRSPENLLIDSLNKFGLAGCINTVLHFYADISNAAAYLQRQLELTDSQVQDVIESVAFVADGGKNLIMGLPLPKEGTWVTARNYSLADTIGSAAMKFLPPRGSVILNRNGVIDNDEIMRLHHVAALVAGFMPKAREPHGLPERTRALLTDVGEPLNGLMKGKTPSLHQLRLSSLEAGTHDHAWCTNLGVLPCRFSVGDFGYIPQQTGLTKSGKSFKDFVLLGNTLRGDFAKFVVERTCHGTQFCWKDFPMTRQPVSAFSLTGDIQCWPIVVPPGAQIDCDITHEQSIVNTADAWRFLIQESRSLAEELGIRPHDLILITQTGLSRHAYVNDFATSVKLGPSHWRPQPLGVRQLPRPFFPHQPPAMATPMYLHTSFDDNYEPYWSHQPQYMSHEPQSKPPPLSRGWTSTVGSDTQFVYWIQLLPEDFDDA